MNETTDATTQAETTDQRGYIAVDLDGTLAHYDHWRGSDHIGEPVPAMLARVKMWLAEGKEVRIFTARVYPLALVNSVDCLDAESFDKMSDQEITAWQSAAFIRAWCLEHIGQVLPITCQKDYGMVELYDDRCCYVFPNQGMTHREHQGAMQASLLEIANALGVTVTTGMNFKDVADLCAERARAGNPKADRAQAVLALIDGADDALRYAVRVNNSPDLSRAQRNLTRALPLLRELAGKKGSSG